MYKATHNNHDYLKRVASHSTKPKRNGRVDVLPPSAQEAEQTYLTALEQLNELNRQFQVLQTRAREINELLTHKQRHDVYLQLLDERKSIGQRIQRIQSALTETRNVGRAAAENSYAEVFFHVAKLQLRPDLLEAITKETETILGRGWNEGVGYSGTRGGMNDARKARENAREQLRVRRRKSEALATRIKEEGSEFICGTLHRRPSMKIDESKVIDRALRRVTNS